MTAPAQPVEYTGIDGTALRISRVGFGCWAIGGHGYGEVDDRVSLDAIQAAVESGITFFDTADTYGFGRSETVLGAGLGSKRHDMVIATKGGVCWDDTGKVYRDSSGRRMREAVDESLRRLRLDCIPLYQLHGHDGVSPLEETMEALVRCQEAGKIRHIGCTNLDATQVAAMASVGPLASIQLQFSLADRSREALLRDCHGARRMGTIVYGALVRGLLSGQYDRDARFGANDTRSRDGDFEGPQLERHLALVQRLSSLGARYDRTPAQVALRWVLDLPFISTIIVGMKTRQQVLGNMGSMGWRLADDSWQELARWSGPVEQH